jgi:hypothetical protein
MHFDSFLLGARHLFQKLVLFFLCEVIKISIRITKKKHVIPFKNKYSMQFYSHFTGAVGRFYRNKHL